MNFTKLHKNVGSLQLYRMREDSFSPQILYAAKAMITALLRRAVIIIKTLSYFATPVKIIDYTVICSRIKR